MVEEQRDQFVVRRLIANVALLVMLEAPMVLDHVRKALQKSLPCCGNFPWQDLVLNR